MGFTHECIISKNTSELRASLEKLGYKYGIPPYNHYGYRSLVTYNGLDGVSKYYGTDKVKVDNVINCGTNEELFLAIAALRDESDKAQWFVSDANQFTGMCMTAVDFGEFRFCSIDKFPPSGLFHKATVEELIKHFSK